LPEPDGELLAAQRTERPQEDPYERRILADGAVWERSSTHAEVRDGQVVFSRVPLEWRRIAQLEPAGVEQVRAAIGPVLELAEEHTPPGTSAGGSIVTYTVAGGHTVRLVNLTAAQVPGLAELDMAMQLAVAGALHPE
jgi:hypothetical protein